MPVPIFDFITTMERDIADFYLKLRSVARLSSSASVFEFMSEHSMGHADRVSGLAREFEKPDIDQAFFRKVHEQIKQSLFQEVTDAPNMKTAIEKMARTEELVGKLYEVIADYYRKLAEHYTEIAKEISLISKEEFQHRDMIMKEKGKY